MGSVLGQYSAVPWWVKRTLTACFTDASSETATSLLWNLHTVTPNTGVKTPCLSLVAFQSTSVRFKQRRTRGKLVISFLKPQEGISQDTNKMSIMHSSNSYKVLLINRYPCRFFKFTDIEEPISYEKTCHSVFPVEPKAMQIVGSEFSRFPFLFFFFMVVWFNEKF